MIRICHVLTDTNVGGAGKMLLNLLSGTQTEDIQHTVLLPDTSDLLPLFKENGLRVIPVHGLYDRSFSIGDYFRLRSILRKESPDIFSANACLSGRLAAARCRISKRIFTRHCVFPVSRLFRFSLLRRFNRWFQQKLSTDMIAVTKEAALNLTETGLSYDSIRIIPNGVPPLCASPDTVSALRAQLGLPEHAFILGTMARLEPYKGHRELVEAVLELLSELPDLFLLCPGTGSELSALRPLAQNAPEHHIQFPGFVSDVASWYALFSVHVNNSYGTEAASLSIMEAASLKKATLATDYGGNTDLIQHLSNGYLIPTHNKEALKQAIRELYHTPDLLQRLSNQAYKSFETTNAYSLMCQSTLALWRSPSANSRKENQ